MADYKGRIDWAQGTGTPLTVTVDLGAENTAWAAGDYAVIQLYVHATAARTWQAKTGTNGWTALAQNTANSGSAYWTTRIFWKKLGASEPDPVFELAGGLGANNGGGYGVILGGVDATTFADSAEARNTGTSTTTATAPTATTATDLALVLRFWTWTDNGNAEAGYDKAAVGSYSEGTEAFEYVNIEGGGSTHAVSYSTKTTAGAVGTATAVASGGSIGAADYWLTDTIPVRPAATTFALTLGSDTVEAGGTVSASVSPAFSGAITAATLEGGDSAAVSAADTDSATLTIPAITQFRSGGTADTTELGAAIDVTVTDGTDTSEVDTLTITAPTGWYLVTVSANYADLSTNAKAWANASTVIGDKYLITGTNVVGVTTDLEIGFGPGTTEFTHVRWDGSAWGTAGTHDFDEDVEQVLTTDAVEYVAGGTIACTIAPATAATPASATLGGVSVSVGGATTTACDVAIPAIAEFLPTGDMEAVPFGSFVELVVTMSDASTLSAFVLLAPSADVNTAGEAYWTGAVSESQAGQGVFANFIEGDGYLFVVEQGAITGITDEGVITYDTYYGGKMYRFEA
jgi:hypothetical protein